MKEDRSYDRPTENSKVAINWWKWSFITLITLIVLLFSLLLISIQPKKISEPNLSSRSKEDEQIVLETTLNKKDIEKFINSYLSSASENDENLYTVEIEDELFIKGHVDILSFDVPFSLSFDPYVLENGNLQLRADSLELASFSLPVSAVMSIFASQLDLPDFIAIDTKEQMIVINFNELDDTKVGIELTKIDLINDIINVNLSFKNDNLIKQMNQTKD